MDNESQIQRFFQGLGKKVVMIYFKGERGFKGHGVLVSEDGLILTACHLFFDTNTDSFAFEKNVGDEVIIKALKVNGNESDNETYYARITILDKFHDIAALQIVRPFRGESRNFRFDYAPISPNVSVGETVYMVVSSDSVNWELSKGMVSCETRLYKDMKATDETKYYNPDAPLVEVLNLHGIPGCSGAPVFNSQGNIVGVYSFYCGRRDILAHFRMLQASLALAQANDKNDENPSLKRRKRKESSRGKDARKPEKRRQS